MIIGMYKGCCSNLLNFSRLDLRPDCKIAFSMVYIDLRALHPLILLLVLKDFILERQDSINI